MTISSNDFYPAHETAMRCLDEAIEFTSDIESEYALTAMLKLFEVAPELAEVASSAFNHIKDLIESGVLRDFADTIHRLSNLSCELQAVLSKLK